MKRFILILLLSGSLQAQTGDAAVASTNAASDSQWQNWTFAGTFVATATGAVLILLTDTGSQVH
ncbi:MAG TPA: hypothetical protein VLF94_02345 [Chlamydiales bacterium]|nr:hypothetical protein [Chlamydiales bacterium]